MLERGLVIPTAGDGVYVSQEAASNAEEGVNYMKSQAANLEIILACLAPPVWFMLQKYRVKQMKERSRLSRPQLQLPRQSQARHDAVCKSAGLASVCWPAYVDILLTPTTRNYRWTNETA